MRTVVVLSPPKRDEVALMASAVVIQLGSLVFRPRLLQAWAAQQQTRSIPKKNVLEVIIG
jgi:hypothetical protein